jgi:hypothetical protein
MSLFSSSDTCYSVIHFFYNLEIILSDKKRKDMRRSQLLKDSNLNILLTGITLDILNFIYLPCFQSYI